MNANGANYTPSNPRPWPQDSGGPSLLEIVTLVLWMVLAAIGILGLTIPYPRIVKVARKDQPVIVPMPEAEVKQMPMEKLPAPAPAPSLDAPPAAPDAVNLPQIAAPVAVASPSAVVAFALPVEGPVRVVDARRAKTSRPSVTGSTNATTRASAPPAVKSLVFGVGEGKKPQPDYPPAAIHNHEEGTVGIRMTVNEDGSIREAEVVRPCIWPLLNQAALRAVRTRWRFEPGGIRIFEVPIQFQLQTQ